ncbi:hypothetical protein CANINC_001384 [Pichia inconspicua]|uniref:ATPase expression protein 2, mitochondrial n=1 Tax=Pichia inconspicua TaxID=52247 RepID=A0A4T0X432_9ASCO|nr:hypothetical protein CANINC_001384 [[Candida] inconspicua]
MYRRSKVSRRNISFFVPTSRISEFNKRQNQSDASIEVLERNYNDIRTYYNTTYKVLQNTAKLQRKITFRKEKDLNLVSQALNSIALPFTFTNTNLSILNKEPNDDTKVFGKILKILNNSAERSIYDVLKTRTTKIRRNINSMDQSFISTSIQRLIDFNQIISKRLWFLTANRTKTEFDSSKLSAIVRSISRSTNKIFNSFTTDTLSVYDCEKLALFYLNKHQFRKAIELVSKIETLSQIPNSGYYLTNSMWLIKFEILGKTHHHLWKTYGHGLYSINRKGKLSSFYQYPHHSHNFKTLIQRYQDYKENLQLPDSLPITNAIIRGLGKHGDLDSLDKMIEALYGIRVDRSSDKGIYLMEHFNIEKHVPMLLWPDENTLISLLLAYSKNGEFSTAVKINDLLLHHYQTIHLNARNMRKYWEITLRTAGHFGDAVDRQLISELGDEKVIDAAGDSLLDLKYRLFDVVYAMATGQLKSVSRGMIDLKMKYASVDNLVEELPLIFSVLTAAKFNTSAINIIANENTLKKYITVCCKELAKKGLFLDASKVIENFSPSREVYQELKNALLVLQERYARDKAREEERKRKQIDEEDDFELW